MKRLGAGGSGSVSMGIKSRFALSADCKTVTKMPQEKHIGKLYLLMRVGIRFGRSRVTFVNPHGAESTITPEESKMVALLQRLRFRTGALTKAPDQAEGTYPDTPSKEQIKYLHETADDERRSWKLEHNPKS